jgi:hypothetical protein
MYLHNTTEEFGMKVSPLKPEVMTCKEQVLVRSKTVIDNTILEQVNKFTHFGC